MKLLFILFSLIICWTAYQPRTSDEFTPSLTDSIAFTDEVFFQSTQLGLDVWPALHSSNVIELHNQDLLVSWFAGTREGHTDVGLYTQRFTHDTQTWDAPFLVTNRQRTSVDLNRYIKKVGNAVITEIQDNHLMMIYVSVSVGGWATSQLNVMHSYDNGFSWNQAQRIVTTPFFNISTLVRAHPILNQQNEIWLPAYYELAQTSSQIIKLDTDNNIHFIQGIKSPNEALAPVLVIQDNHNIQVLQRPKPAGNIQVAQINLNNSGIKVNDFQNPVFTNPNASIDVISITQNLWLMAYNPLDLKRQALGLAISVDQGKTWMHKKWVEKRVTKPKSKKIEYSYPSLKMKKNGDIALSYTHNRKSIYLVEFNLAWLLSEDAS
ncbi:exo-alpha-sialidase [Marinicellulosiphila megalodicopiae]|uniref:exo-alpha-sialidase n=1 Tax=Marinicellulosiphila megalodicopiae TaxID=2724896 RepID=UPI003BB140C6